MHLTKQTKQKVTYKVSNGKLCIEHHIILQQLTFRKKGKNEEYKKYHSYFIKLPKAIYDLLSPTKNIIYLKHQDDKLFILKNNEKNTKKVRIQVDNRSIDNITEYNRYKISIPKKFIKEKDYKRGKSYMKCQIISSNNNPGYIINLKQHNIR